MTKDEGKVWIYVIAAVVAAFAIFEAVDIWKSKPQHVDCGDGPRLTIDVRQFSTQYSAYSIELEASIEKRGSLSAKFTPVQLTQLTESMQTGNEFRKAVVNGYNACAITKVQYAQMVPKFQALDGLAREINALIAQSTLTPDEQNNLSGLIGQYGQLTQKLGSE